VSFILLQSIGIPLTCDFPELAPETGGSGTVSQLTEVICLSLYMDVSIYLDRSANDTWTDHSIDIYLPKGGDYADRRHHPNRE
jgi:hypothetical protein